MNIEEVLKTSRFSNEVHKATLNLLFTSYWLKTNLSAAIKENDLTSEQFNVMRILKGKHPEQMCVKDIGERMIEKNSNVPRIIHRLLIKKLVQRTESAVDKRETLISLTEQGIAKLNEANAVVDRINKTLIGINEEEAAVLNTLLEKVRGEF